MNGSIVGDPFYQKSFGITCGGQPVKSALNRFVIGSLSALLTVIGLWACAQTAPQQTNASQPAVTQNPAPPSAVPLQPPSYPSANAGASGGQFEQPPTVPIGEFLPVSMQSGAGYYLLPQVPTNGAMG